MGNRAMNNPSAMPPAISPGAPEPRSKRTRARRDFLLATFHHDSTGHHASGSGLRNNRRQDNAEPGRAQDAVTRPDWLPATSHQMACRALGKGRKPSAASTKARSSPGAHGMASAKWMMLAWLRVEASSGRNLLDKRTRGPG